MLDYSNSEWHKEAYEKDHDPNIAMKTFIDALDHKVPIPEWVLKALDECPKLQKYRPFPDGPESEFLSLDELKTRWNVSDNFKIAKHIFTWYVGTVIVYGTIYGPLTAFIVFLLWVFYSSCIFLVGAEIVHSLTIHRK